MDSPGLNCCSELTSGLPGKCCASRAEQMVYCGVAALKSASRCMSVGFCKECYEYLCAKKVKNAFWLKEFIPLRL